MISGVASFVQCVQSLTEFRIRGGFEETRYMRFYNCRALLQDTLTGFKWMSNKALELQQQGKVVLLAFEESIGMMTHQNGHVADSDSSW